MDGASFDRLTRRLVIGIVAGGPLWGVLGHHDAAAKRGSKRKRCRRKKRVFCAGRCCAKGARCQHGACLTTCDDPVVCGVGGGAVCDGNDQCFCVTAASDVAACVALPDGTVCLGLPACTGDGDCPVGQICATCNCLGGATDLRCLRPCSAL